MVEGLAVNILHSLGTHEGCGMTVYLLRSSQGRQWLMCDRSPVYAAVVR